MRIRTRIALAVTSLLAVAGAFVAGIEVHNVTAPQGQWNAYCAADKSRCWAEFDRYDATDANGHLIRH